MSAPVNSSPTAQVRLRGLLTVAAVLVLYAAVDFRVRRFALLFVAPEWFDLAYQGLRLLFICSGIAVLTRVWPSTLADARSMYPLQSRWLGWGLGSDSATEMARGAALGWAVAVALVLPIALDGGLLLFFDSSAGAWGRLVLVLLATALGAALRQVLLCGLAFRKLTDATRPLFAMGLIAGFAVLTQMQDLRASWPALLTVFLFELLVLLSVLRTGSLWFGWAADFSAHIFLGAALGFSVLGSPRYSAPVLAGSNAPAWLSGGSLGPAAGLCAPIVLLAAILMTLRLTHADPIARIRPAGIAMDVASPHAPAFPAAPAPAVAGSSLVQILPGTPDSTQLPK